MAVNKNTNNDPFEEFEFRPINEGLGFHRKQKNNFTISNNTASNISSTSTSTNLFETPLPRNDFRSESLRSGTKKSLQVPNIEDDSIAKAQTAVNEILKNLNHKRQTDFIYETEKQKVALKKSKPFLLAATLDAMLISAAFLMSMIAMLSVTKVDLFLNLSHSATSRFVYIATAGLFFTITFIYMVISRTFSGCTPGEWAFDQLCGNDPKMSSIAYIPRVVLRTLLVMLTGFITMPLLSYLFNKDYAGELSGISLYIKPTTSNATNS